MLIHNAEVTGSLNINNVPFNSGSFSGSFQGDGSQLTGITGASTASYVEYSNVGNKPALVSSSAQIVGYGIFATTGSNSFNGSQVVTGSLTVTGQVVAQTLNVQQVTSSIVYSSGSNIFGNSLSNTQQFTGSVSVTGSMNVNGTPVSVGTGSNGQVTFWNGTSSQTGDNDLFWDNTNKRLGIGTASPSTPLTVQGASSDGVAIFRDTTSLNVGTGGSIRFEGQTTTGGGFTTGLGVIIGGKENATSGNTSSYIAFQTRINLQALTERWRITSTGVLQSNGAQTIQTSTGNLTLTSADNTGIVDIRRTDRVLGAELRLTNSFNGSGYLAGDIIGTLNFFTSDATGIGPHSVANITAVSGGENAASPDGNLVFSTGGYNVAASEKWRITSAGILQSNLAQTIQTSTGNLTLATAAGNGNILLTPNGTGRVGIGTTGVASFDSVPLLVVGGGTEDSGIAIFTSSSNAGYLQFADGTSGAEEYRGFIKYDHSTNAMSFSTNSTARTEAEMTIFSDGNTFIGTSPSNAGFKLDVNGTGRFSGAVSATNGLFNSDFLANETSKVGISFASGYGQINSWGANTSTYGGLKFQLSVSNGGTFNALTIDPSGATSFSSTISAGQSLFQVLDTGVGTKTIVSTLERTGATPSGNQREVGIVFKDGNNPTIVGGITGIRYNSSGNFIGGLRFYVQNTSATPATSFSNLLEALTLDYTGAATFSSSINAKTLTLADSAVIQVIESTTGTNFNGVEFKNTGGSFYIGQDNSAGNFYGSNTAYSGCLYTSGARPIVFLPGTVERVRISANGLSFNGDTAAANALDDYEEGTWTPVIGGTGGESGQSYGGQTGYYTKIGRQVTVTFRVLLSNKGTITGNVAIKGLPFTIDGSGVSHGAGVTYFEGLATSWSSIFLMATGGETYATIDGIKSAATLTTRATTSDIGNTTQFNGSMTYFV
jgi:hypothetical protein